MRTADEPNAENANQAVYLTPEEMAADPVVEAPVVARPWLDMTDAPKDGSLIEVITTLNPNELAGVRTAYWRITRRRVPQERAWKVIGFWADPAKPTEQLLFEPAAWRYPDFRTA